MRLLNVEKMSSANRPGAARTARTAPRTSTAGIRSVAADGLCSGMRIVSRCASAARVNAIAIASVQPMPSTPTDSPLNTLVTTKERPCTVPTRPFAFGRRSSGTSSVTVVDSAMLRMFSTTAPARMTPAKIQNQGPPRSSSARSGKRSHRTPATANAARVTAPENTMTRCLRCRSTIVPKSIAKIASSSMYAPPTMPVARTDRVSR
ncbi:hypothetical protein SRABI128_04685 [Microbacterium sp. Bi128]|nr:hypothetical protein SRABI128_04685 [Microbacterium sp. Bi128]